MSELLVEYDSERQLWSASSTSRHSGAGVATYQFSREVAVHADLLTGHVVEATFAPELGSRGLSSEGLALVQKLFVGEISSGRIVDLNPAIGEVCSRLALLADGLQEARARGPASGWWLVEEKDLRAMIGLEGVVSRGSGVANARRLPSLGVVDDETLHQYAASLLSVVGSTLDHLDLSVAASRERLRNSVAKFGALPHSGSGIVALDPGFVSGGLVDLRLGATVERDGLVLLVAMNALPDTYLAGLAGVSVVLVDEEDLVVGVSSLSLSRSSGESARLRDAPPIVEARFVVSEQRELGDLEVMLLDSQASIPSKRLRELRSDSRLARQGAAAARLGDVEYARSLLELAGEFDSDIELCLRSAAQFSPFLGELVDAAQMSEI
ncbi:MAG TPA: hypothetical protein DEG43_04750 [Acidimicrobiaceae bacterium]|nr:hypothetical protein [Acidimicrobiaceae bacterium]